MGSLTYPAALLGPALALSLAAVGLIGAGISRRSGGGPARAIGVLSLLAAAVFIFDGRGFGGGSFLLREDGLSRAWCLIFYAGALPFLLAGDWESELPVLLTLSSLLGMTLLAFSANLIMLFIALELLSLPVYLLVALGSKSRASRAPLEAAIKYFFAGSIGAAIFLLGLACHYAATRGFGFSGDSSPMDRTGFALMAVAALFKTGAVPWHFWLPDVYEASDPLLVGFLSTSVKAAGIFMLMRLAAASPAGFAAFLPAIGALTMIVAAFLALRQKKVQRLLAYSSLGHAGALVLGVGAWAALGARASLALPIFFYLAAYVFMSNGAFFFLKAADVSDWSDLRGLGFRRPFLGGCFAALALSLAGIPPGVGFLAKFLIFWQAFEARLYVPLLVASGAALVALVYYLRLAREMYFEAPAPERRTEPPPRFSEPIIALCAAVSAVMGFVPWTLTALSGFLGGPL